MILGKPVGLNGRPSKPEPVAETSFLGLPRFDWSLTLVGFCVFTFVVVTYRIRIGEIGIAIGVMGLLFQRGGLKIPVPVWFYAAFVLWAFIGSFASSFPEIAREQIIERLKLVVVMIVAVNALRTEGQLRFYLLFFLGCFILFPVRGTLVGGDTIMGRAIWNYIYSNPNDLAALSLIALGVALAIMFSEPSRTLVQFGAGISVTLLLVVILLTQSRGAFIGLVVGMGPGTMRLLMKRQRLLVPAVLVVLIIGYVTPTSVWERLAGIEQLTSVETIAQADPEGSAEQRFQIQQVAWRIVGDHPLFGVGLGVYPIANAMYAPELGQRDTHNTYLNLAAETGLPGLVLWCALFGSVLLHASRSRRDMETTTLAAQQIWIERALIGYLVAGLVGTYSALTFPYLMLAVLWCSANLLSVKAHFAPGVADTNKA
jgi:O-antigen ligase